MKILVYDSEAGGHHREYFRYLKEYWAQAETDGHLYFATHPDVAEDIEEEVPQTCTVLPLDRATVDELENTQQAWRRSLKEWSAMEEMAQQCEPDHCVVSSLNWFQFALALPQAYWVDYTISGILFFPYPRWKPESASTFDAALDRIRLIRKRTILWLMMRNPMVSTVHVLNDPKVAQYLNGTLDSRERFQALPDPAPVLPDPPSSANLRARYDIDANRTLFLFFGTISRRKGVLMTLEALKDLPADVRGEIAVVFVGRLKLGQKEAIRAAVREVETLCQLQIRTDFRFVDPDELALALRDCDVVLAPYQRTEGSSGVLGHVARSGKPVIGPRTGLIGEIIRKYDLGVTIDASHARELSEAIVTAHRDSFDDLSNTSGMRKYVADHAPDAFARQLLKP